MVWKKGQSADWQLVGQAAGIPVGADLHEVYFHDGIFAAVGMTPNPDHPRRMVPIALISEDGLSWSEASIRTTGIAGDDVWFEQAVAGNEGIVMLMHVSSGHSAPLFKLRQS